jgi:hypothetical protein
MLTALCDRLINGGIRKDNFRASVVLVRGFGDDLESLQGSLEAD